MFGLGKIGSTIHLAINHLQQRWRGEESFKERVMFTQGLGKQRHYNYEEREGIIPFKRVCVWVCVRLWRYGGMKKYDVSQETEYLGESMKKKYNREEGKGRIMEGVLYLMTETGLHSIGNEGRCF